MNTIWTVLIVIGALLFLGGGAVIFLVVTLKNTAKDLKQKNWSAGIYDDDES